jgi:phage I-like protein
VCADNNGTPTDWRCLDLVKKLKQHITERIKPHQEEVARENLRKLNEQRDKLLAEQEEIAQAEANKEVKEVMTAASEQPKEDAAAQDEPKEDAAAQDEPIEPPSATPSRPLNSGLGGAGSCLS